MTIQLVLQYIFMGFAALMGLAVLIGVHEYGHFIVAKKLGFMVQKFSIGFGKPIWQHTGKDGTEYGLAWMPVGGYVKLLDERNTGEDIPAGKEHMAFGARPVWARIAVLVAGPGFNFIFAIIAFWLVFMSGIEGRLAVIDTPQPGTPAALAGLQAEDEIIQINDEPIGSWRKANIVMLEAILDDPVVNLTLRNPRNEVRQAALTIQGSTRELTRPNKLMPSLGLARWMEPLPPVIDQVTLGMPAASAGLKTGDRVISVDGVLVAEWGDMVQAVTGQGGKALTFEVMRGSSKESIIITPEFNAEANVARIGVTPSIPEGYGEKTLVTEKFTPVAALKEGVYKTYYYSALTLSFLGKMVTGKVSTENLSGPITIVEYAGKSAIFGWDIFLHFLAFLSLSLGVLNLLPVPMLDGGQVVYQLIEWIKGSPISMVAQELGQKVGVALLLVLFAFAFYNDFVRLFDKF